ncbi:prepilin-type N-terminal cleavage/methylation domain-containing protein [Noviherbaspirillum massiliense]|uniref:prepilin-type N-terminal cleavage/methylation domain-containing protein n=1 Tax=Noviherbaspirillum massiliense TaxID=1465823 RepID=UPI0002D9C724|nr:prepilin-type N-terminal cleavage/methylation domain-containing protein [Noviherbaspirillum massiliense]
MKTGSDSLFDVAQQSHHRQRARGKQAAGSHVDRLHFQHGFTLVEAIIVIVITAVIAAVVAIFIPKPVQAYFDSADRAALTDVADTALRRMARDLRLALPNSIRVSADGKYLELLLTKTGGRYLAEEDMATGNPLRFDTCDGTSGDRQFDVVGAALAGNSGSPFGPEQQIASGDYVVVYNLGQAPADAYNCTASCNRAQVSSTPTDNTIRLDSNPFCAQPEPRMKSPSMRFQVVATPVTYYCDGSAGGLGGTLTRYWDYTIQEGPPPVNLSAGTSPKSALLATGVVSCSFDYDNLRNIHSGLVGLTITLQVPNSNSGAVTLFHQVHVDNTP